MMSLYRRFDNTCLNVNRCNTCKILLCTHARIDERKPTGMVPIKTATALVVSGSGSVRNMGMG